MSCHCPLPPWLQVLWGPLEWRRRKRDGAGMLSWGGGVSWVLFVEVLISSRNLRGDFRWRSQKNIHQLSSMLFQCYALHWLVGTRAEGHYSILLVLRWACPCLELKYHRGVDVISREKASGGLNQMTSDMLGEEKCEPFTNSDAIILYKICMKGG